jgi:AraC family transcriptional regulator
MKPKEVTIRIKHMVCPRCIKVVSDELKRLGLNLRHVALGEATFKSSSHVSTLRIETVLKKQGFELIKTPEEELVESIKRTIIEVIHQRSFDSLPEDNKSVSNYLAGKLKKSYSYLSKVFSTHKGITIERYTILQKIELAKALIEYGEMNFATIALRLGYKSPQHLANQFKNITGMSMSSYQKLPRGKRKSLDIL